jgi:hypothetical protein
MSSKGCVKTVQDSPWSTRLEVDRKREKECAKQGPTAVATLPFATGEINSDRVILPSVDNLRSGASVYRFYPSSRRTQTSSKLFEMMCLKLRYDEGGSFSISDPYAAPRYVH